MKKARSGSARPTTAPSPASTAERIAWYALLVGLALVPLAMAIVPGANGTRIPLTEDPYQVAKVLALALTALVATASWVYQLLFEQRSVRTAWALAPLGAFATLVGVSTATGIEPLNSLFGASGLMTGTITWLGSAWFAFLLSQYAVSGQRLREVSWALVGSASVASVIGILQSLGLDLLGTPFVPETQWMVKRGLSTLGNPDYAGLYLVTPAIVAVGLALAAKTQTQRWLAWCSTALLVGAAFVTLTRAAWLGIVLALLVLLVAVPAEAAVKRRRFLQVGGAALGAALVAFLLAGPENVVRRFSSVGRGLDAFSSGRITMWNDVLRLIAEHPLFGTGADRLALGAYPLQTKVVTEGINRYVLQDPHNVFLLIAGSFGLIAMVSFVAYIGMAMVQGWQFARAREEQSAAGTLYWAWFAGTVGYLTASTLSVYTVTGVFMLFVTLGIVVAPLLKAREAAWETYAVAIVGVMVVALTLFGATQSFRASRLVMLSSQGDSQARLEAAMRIAPWDTRTRVTYQWRKVGSFRQVIQGTDTVAAKQVLEQLDGEILGQIVRSPDELLWYRMRVDLHRIAQGFPAYDPAMVLAAVEDALLKFPTDPEFLEWREQFQAEVDAQPTP